MKYSLYVLICLLVLSLALGDPIGLRGNHNENAWNENLEAKVRARLLEDKKEIAKNSADSGSDMPSINMNNVLVEKRLMDCEKRQEIIIIGNDGSGKGIEGCYLHKMNDAFYKSVCLGKGQEVNEFYYIKAEIVDKDFLSQNGPESECRNRPMYLMTYAEDMNAISSQLSDDKKKGKWFDNWDIYW